MGDWYLVALGANVRGRHGTPAQAVRAAAAAIGVRALSPIIASDPVGPSTRRFANAVARVDSDDAPPAMLARLKAIETAFGRRHGRRWGARVIDLDLIGWSGGVWRSRTLTIPHTAYRKRLFVVAPLLATVPAWRDPITGLTPRHLNARLTRARPVNRRLCAGVR